MLPFAMIVLRIVFAASVIAAAILPRFFAMSDNRRVAATLTAIGAAILLLVLRLTMRATMPDRLPPSTG